MAEFKYEITQELGVISEGKYNIELNMVSLSLIHISEHTRPY